MVSRLRNRVKQERAEQGNGPVRRTPAIHRADQFPDAHSDASGGIAGESGKFEGVGRGVMGRIRLWKCAEKCGKTVSSESWGASRKIKMNLCTRLRRMRRPRLVILRGRRYGDSVVQVFHFSSFSILSLTRNAVIWRISGSGSGFSSGNWIEPFAVTNFESSFAKALTAEGVG